MDLKHVLKVLIIFLILYAVILFVNFSGLNNYLGNYVSSQSGKKLIQVFTIDGFQSNIDFNKIAFSGSQSFCSVNKGYKLEEACNKLTRNKCGETSCCIWTNNKNTTNTNNKCVAGNENGPTFTQSKV
jgi:hypothetical protein